MQNNHNKNVIYAVVNTEQSFTLGSVKYYMRLCAYVCISAFVCVCVCMCVCVRARAYVRVCVHT